MKIVICGSMSASVQMMEVRDSLVEAGHEVTLPRHTEEYSTMVLPEEVHSESVKNKVEQDLIRDYYEKIKESDAVLIVNVEKNGVENYIGGNSFLEMAFAHVLNKKLYVLNDLPDMSYADELLAMQPVVVNGNLSLIV